METNKALISQTLANRMMSCIAEYERIKRKESTTFKTVKSFCAYHRFSHQNFMKIYHRYQANPEPASLLPQQRGPKYRTRRIDLQLEEEIISLRKLGNNRYEIRNVLKDKNAPFVPSATSIYYTCKKYGLNKLKQPERQARRRMVMSRVGELVHIDCHQLSKGITMEHPDKTYYLLGLIDGYSRVAWAEVLEDKKALTVMFAALKSLNILKKEYNVEVESILSDNGAEFGSGPLTKSKDEHPFERMLMEMEIAHRYTKPYRPQTNGKIERFWKTLNEDFVEGALYENMEDLKNELLAYLVYYNSHRPHSGINGLTPREMINM